jgi:hypothetical protein
MAFPITVDEYSVLSVGGAYSYISMDSLSSQSFVFQIGSNYTMYPSVSNIKLNLILIKTTFL